MIIFFERIRSYRSDLVQSLYNSTAECAAWLFPYNTYKYPVVWSAKDSPLTSGEQFFYQVTYREPDFFEKFRKKSFRKSTKIENRWIFNFGKSWKSLSLVLKLGVFDIFKIRKICAAVKKVWKFALVAITSSILNFENRKFVKVCKT